MSGAGGDCVQNGDNWTTYVPNPKKNPSIPLAMGDNIITVLANDTVCATLTIHAIDPTIAALVNVGISKPTTGPTISQPLNITATATSTTGLTMHSVNWYNSTGLSGSLTLKSGSYTGGKGILQPGTNEITVVATDTLGNTGINSTKPVYLDDDGPTLNITSPYSGAVYNTTNQYITISGNSDDNVGFNPPNGSPLTWSNSRDSGNGGGNCNVTGIITPPVAPTSIPNIPGHVKVTWTTPVFRLYKGLNNITVVATDTSLNTNTATVVVNYADTDPPTVTITRPTNGYNSTTSTASLSGVAVDNTTNTAAGISGISTLACFSNRGAVGTIWTYNAWLNWQASIALAPGANIITVYATDSSGNVSLPATVTINYNPSGGPQVIFTTPTSNLYYATTLRRVNIGGTITDDASSSVTSVNWVNSLGGSGTCSFNSSNGTWQAVAVPLQIGLNNITVTANDVKSNGAKGSGSAKLPIACSWDIQPPVLTITSPTPKLTYSTSTQMLALSGSAKDNITLTSITWANDRGANGICQFQPISANSTNYLWNISGIKLSPGVNVITITSTDAAGNHGSATLTVTYTDVDPPTVNITSPTTAPPYSTTNSTFAFAGNADDNVGVTLVSWSNNRGGSGTCALTPPGGTDINGINVINFSATGINLQPGDNVITITAFDAAGNANTDSGSPPITLTVNYADLTPTISITSPTTAATYTSNTPSIILSGTASDNVDISQVTWSSDHGGSGTCTGTTSWSTDLITLASGANVITVTAYSNTTPQYSATATITVTYTPGGLTNTPVVTILSPTLSPRTRTNVPTLNVGGTASDSVEISSVVFSTDKGANGTCSGTTSWLFNGVALQPGRNVITVTATDKNGGQGSAILRAYYSPNNTLLAGIDANGCVWYTKDMTSAFTQIPGPGGTCSDLTIGDFNGDGQSDIAALATDHTIWYTTDLSSWANIPGHLSSLISGDFAGTGSDGLAGIASDGSIWYTTDLLNWTNIPGSLQSIVAGDFSRTGNYGIAGIASDWSIWYTVDLQNWINIPGKLSSIATGDFNNSGKDNIVGLASDNTIWYTTDMSLWTNMSGLLTSITMGDYNGDGSIDVGGLAGDGSVWYTITGINVLNIPAPGIFKNLTSGDFINSTSDRLAALEDDGSIWYTPDLSTWVNIQNLTLKKIYGAK